MGKYSLGLVLLLVAVFPLVAEETVVNTLSSVDLIVEQKYNEDKHKYGEDYYSINHNEKPAIVSIKLTENENVYDGLVTTEIMISPKERIHLGWVIQKDITKPANWNYQWTVTLQEEE